jgi:hypothetical protein
MRKLVVGFGNLFNNITLVRYNPDNSEAERILVPIAYADKENYVRRLQADPNLDKKVQITLPRFSFEMTGFTYDSSRKQNTNTRNFASTNNGIVSQYNPVPYNFNFKLYLYVRNIEDGTQVAEHILSYFTPDYTIKLNMIPEMGIIKEVPIILNSADQEVDYEGNRDRETRIIIWTFDFTVKGFIFGPVTPTGGIIKTSITHIMNNISENDEIVFNVDSGLGNYQVGEFVYQGYSYPTATATAKVVSWSNNNLVLTNISGNFVTGQKIIGTITNSNYNFVSHVTTSMSQNTLATITVTPNPVDAEANSNYTYTTTIVEGE